MKPGRRADWNRLKKLALGLKLPGVEEATSCSQPTLKAHGKLWVWWSPHEDAPVFKVPFEERDMLVEHEPETFFFLDRSGVIQELSTDDRIDVLTSLEGMDFHERLERAGTHEVDGVSVYAMSPADLDEAAEHRFRTEGRR